MPSLREGTRRALVVDDEPLVRDVVAQILRVSGLEVETAASGEAGLPRIEAGRFDLVVSDLRMPGAGGFCLLSEAKRIDPALPFIVLTGFGDVEASVEALRLGADDFLTKPVKMAELLRVCERAVEKGRLLRENLAQKERLENLYAVKSRFLASMSHELRTPLTTIIGMGELLGDEIVGELNDKQRKYVSSMLVSARHLLQLINDILDYSKIEAGRMELDLEPLVALDAMQGAAALVEGLAVARRVRLELVPPAVDGAPPADRTKVVQVLVNLLSNAIKFSPEGSVVVLSCRESRGELRFAVADRGVGIPSESLEAVFAEFQQLSSTSNVKAPGTGLGLSLSRKLARMHGGDIQVESVFGSGSTFTLVLPLTTAPASAPALQKGPAPGGEPGPRPAAELALAATATP